MVPLPPRIDKELRWNWKVHHENALEAYHTDYVHKNARDSAPSHLTRFKTFQPGDGQVMMETGFAPGQGDLYAKEGATIVASDGLRDDKRRRVLFVSVLPTFFAVVQPAESERYAAAPARREHDGYAPFGFIRNPLSRRPISRKRIKRCRRRATL